MFGILEEWNELTVTWYDTLLEAQAHKHEGNDLIVKIDGGK